MTSTKSLVLVITSLIFLFAQDLIAKEGEAGVSQPKETTLRSAKVMTRIAKANSASSAEYHFSLAQAYGYDGEVERAIEEYKLALVFDPKSALLLTRLAAEYIKKGELAPAMEACKEALSHDPASSDARLMLGGLYASSRDLSNALAQYDELLKRSPRSEEAVAYRSQLLIEHNQEARAIQSLRKFVHKNPDSALAWYYLGRAESQLDHFENANIAYRKALKIKPGFSQAALALGFLYEESQLTGRAIDTYKRLFDESQDIAAANRLSILFLKMAKYSNAIPYLQFLEESDPEDMGVKVKLGLIYMEMKKFDDTIAVFKKILEKNPESDRIHYYLGSVFEETRKSELAIEEYVKVPPTSPFYKDSVLHAAYLMRDARSFDKVKTFIKDAISKSSQISSFYLFQANLEEDSKNSSGAVQILEKASRQFPNDEQVHYYLGGLYDRLGEVDKSLRQMELILSFNPKNVEALNYLGYTWTQKGIRLNDAEKVLRQALGLNPKNGYIQDSWGWYLLTRGRVKEAIVELEKAAKMKPNEPTILEHLGDAYLRSNLREKALTQYMDAAKYADVQEIKKKVQTKVENLRREMDNKAKRRMPASSVVHP